MEIRERYIGALLGLAVGDALGVTLEFQAPGTFAQITDMTGGGPSQLKPGQWSDDTSMCLLLCESLLARNGHDPTDQLERYVRWYREGYLSSTGYCIDIGKTTRIALERFERDKSVMAANLSRSSGNGSIMRLAPVPLFYANSPDIAVAKSGESSLTTHASKECADACRFFGALVVGAVQGASKEDILSATNKLLATAHSCCRFHPEIVLLIQGSYKTKSPPDIKGSGYVVASLEAALWAFYHAESFEEGVLLAVNLGDDADTTGAIYGQLAGAYYGCSAIPAHWQDKIFHKQLICSYAEQLYEKTQV